MHHHSNQFFFIILFKYYFQLVLPKVFWKISIIARLKKNWSLPFKVLLEFPVLESMHSCCERLWLRTELGMDLIFSPNSYLLYFWLLK